MNYLLSYPRSGNTWVRFILEWFSGRPTNGISNNNLSISKSRVSKPKQNKLISNELKHVKGKPIIQKAHWTNQITNKNGKLILLLRNPIEAILRHNPELTNLQNHKDVVWYMDLIKLYDSWDNKRKIIIYYEDLIQEPKKTIIQIVEFMELDLHKVQNFMKSYDYFFNLSINFYDNKGSGGKSKTKGNKIIHHSSKLNEKQKKKFEVYLNKNYCKLLPYLKKYNI